MKKKPKQPDISIEDIAKIMDIMTSFILGAMVKARIRKEAKK